MHSCLTASCTSFLPGSGPVRRRRRLTGLLLPLAALLGGACASAPSPIDQPGPVTDAPHAISCPRGTVFATGQTKGLPSAVWCERPDGRRHGPYIEWWENTQKKSAGLYQEGVRHGTWTFFTPSGQRDSQTEYRNGEAVTAPAGQ